MLYGWNDRPTKAHVKHFIGGDKPATVYKIGEYEVTVPGAVADGDEPPHVTYQSEYRHTSDPRATLPNMEVRDGHIRIELTDLVSLVLSRLEPRELAETLWQDQDVRDEFMRCLTTRYNYEGIDDKERRQFLSGVKEVVHDSALDRLAGTMAKIEYETSRNAHHWDEINRINNVLRERDVKVRRPIYKDGKHEGWEEVILQFDTKEHTPSGRGDLAIGGRAWEEAREFWRDEVRKQFPVHSVSEPSS